jgi:hypothetical protein
VDVRPSRFAFLTNAVKPVMDQVHPPRSYPMFTLLYSQMRMRRRGFIGLRRLQRPKGFMSSSAFILHALQAYSAVKSFWTTSRVQVGFCRRFQKLCGHEMVPFPRLPAVRAVIALERFCFPLFRTPFPSDSWRS